jgi:multiple sugar transport system permease protein
MTALDPAMADAAKPELDLAQQGRKLGVWMTLPAQLLLVFIVVFPLLMQLYVSMTWWGPLDGTPWYQAYESFAWFDNYYELVISSRLWESIGRTALIMIVVIPVEFLIGFGLAILFVDSFAGKRVFYSILLMPMMIVPAVAGYMFFMLFQSNGPINQIIGLFTGGVVDIVWLGDTTLAMVAVMIADIWQWSPLMFLILLAGMLGVPEDQLKAATLLGANWRQKFVRIVLPRMRAVLIIAIVIRTVEAFKLFDVMYIMTKGGPGVATETISLYIYKLTFANLEWAYVAAIGLSILIALSVLAVIGLKMMAKAEEKRAADGVN